MISDQFVMDRLIGAAAGMSCALYFMASGIAWWRVLARPMTERISQKVITDRAIAWSALFVVFLRIVLVRLGLVEWSDDMLDLALCLALLAIWACGIASVRAITRPIYGARIWIAFAAISGAVGIAILFR